MIGNSRTVLTVPQEEYRIPYLASVAPSRPTSMDLPANLPPSLADLAAKLPQSPEAPFNYFIVFEGVQFVTKVPGAVFYREEY